jgi:gliding motility-associated-like protein
MNKSLRFLSLFVICFLSVWSAHAQAFTYMLTGNPVNTTGWSMAPQSSIEADAITLTTNTGSQAGYIYYSTMQNLTNCSQFTVSFDFKISNSSSPTADGFTFWYISNPPTGFTVGGGIGLPNNPNGLVLIFDTYNNNGANTMPKISLRNLDGTSNYVESSTTGLLCPDLVSQTFVIDGTWHTCVLNYNFGVVTVAFDGGAPVMTGNATLNSSGYFGFTAGTGASYAKHQIKNVVITGAPEPPKPAGVDVSFCQGEAAVPLTATGTNLSWFTTPTGGAPLPGAPTPSTTAAGVFNWYVSQEVTGCNVPSVRDTVTVTINPKPAPPQIQVPHYCTDQLSLPFIILNGDNILWYDQPTGGIGTSVGPVVNTAIAGTQTWYATQTNGITNCESDRIPVTAVVHQSPVADFTTGVALACNSDTVTLTNLSTNATNYAWDFGDGTTSIQTSPIKVYQTQNIYSIKLKATNSECADSITKIIDITNPIDAIFSVDKDIICQGDMVTFTNQSVATTVNGVPPSYLWIWGDGNTEAGNSTTHTYVNPGSYTVKLIASNGIPCRDTATKIITVDSLPSLDFRIIDTAICVGHMLQIESSFTADGLSGLSWNFGDTPFPVEAQGNSITHSYENAGAYTVTLNTNYRACPSMNTSKQVKVSALPYINLGKDTSICLHGNPILIGDFTNSTNNSASWKWNTGDTTATILVKHHGTYFATVTIDQCSITDEVEVIKDCWIDIPNAFSPNGDGENDYFFPRQFLTEGVVQFSMNVYNRWGQIVFTTQSLTGRGWDGNFNEKQQPEGVYVYDIRVVMKNSRVEKYSGNITLLR